MIPLMAYKNKDIVTLSKFIFNSESICWWEQEILSNKILVKNILASLMIFFLKKHLEFQKLGILLQPL